MSLHSDVLPGGMASSSSLLDKQMWGSGTPHRSRVRDVRVPLTLPATVFGARSSYLLEEEIGKGAHSTVYRANDRQTGNVVAVKVVDSWAARRTFELFQKEAGIHSELKHDNIVKLLDRTRNGERWSFIVTEMAEGGSLQNQMRRRKALREQASCNGGLAARGTEPGNAGGYNENEVARFMYSVTAAVRYLHDRGLRHRDLKAANVLFMDDNTVKLCDFGLIESVSSRSQKEQMKKSAVADGVPGQSSGGTDGPIPGGTANSGAELLEPPGRSGAGGASASPSDAEIGEPSRFEDVPDSKAAEEESDDGAQREWAGSVYWMSPEAVRGTRQTEASDIWSLGCLCIELLTGLPPLHDRNPANALYHIAESDEVPQVGIPVSAQCAAFLAACFQRDPAKRATAAELLKHAWLAEVAAEEAVKGLVKHRAAPEQVMKHSDAVRLWAESKLLSESPQCREDWLRTGGLKTVIVMLPHITAEQSFCIIRCLAYVVQRYALEEPTLLRYVGETPLWRLPNLHALGKSEELAMLFRACCESQDDRVTFFTPTDPAALRHLLLSTESGVSEMCVQCLHRLVASPPCDSDNANADDDGDAAAPGLPRRGPGDVQPSSAPAAPSLAMWAPNAAHNDVPPHALETTSVFCARGEDGAPVLPLSRRADAVSRAPTEFRQYAVRRRFVKDGALQAIKDILTAICVAAFDQGCAPVMGWKGVDQLFHIIVCLLDAFQNLGTDLDGIVTGTVLASAAASAVATNFPSPNPARAAGHRGTIDPPDAAPERRGLQGSTTTTRQWVKALQEAGWHRCTYAMELLMRYVADQFQIGHVKSDFTDEVPSIAGTFVLVASDAAIPTSLRVRVAMWLPKLQGASPKAAAFLSNSRTNIPLLVHIAKSIPPGDEQDEIIDMLLALVCGDPEMAVSLATTEFLHIVLDRTRAEWERGRDDDATQGINLIEVLFTHSDRQEKYLTWEALNALLMQIVVEEPKPRKANGSDPDPLREAAARLLDAFVAQANIAV